MKSTEPGWTTCWIWRRRWDKLALSTFVLSWLTPGTEQSLQPCLTDWIEVTCKPFKSTFKELSKARICCMPNRVSCILSKNWVIYISVHAANNRSKYRRTLTSESLIARSCWSDVSGKQHKIEYKRQWKTPWCMAENSFYQVTLNCSSADFSCTWCSKGWNIGLTNIVQWKLTVGISRQNLHNHSVALD